MAIDFCVINLDDANQSKAHLKRTLASKKIEKKNSHKLVISKQAGIMCYIVELASRMLCNSI